MALAEGRLRSSACCRGTDRGHAKRNDSLPEQRRRRAFPRFPLIDDGLAGGADQARQSRLADVEASAQRCELHVIVLGHGGPGQWRGRGGRAGRCCTNPHWPARCQPTGFSPADAIRHWSAEGGHPIEDFAAEDYLTPLPGWAPGAKAISDDGLVSEERILHPALTMVP